MSGKNAGVMFRCPRWCAASGGIAVLNQTVKPKMRKNMQVEMTPAIHECLKKCVEFAIQKNAWISAIDDERDEEITMEEALEWLKGVWR
jgi:hypothetical protein